MHRSRVCQAQNLLIAALVSTLTYFHSMTTTHYPCTVCPCKSPACAILPARCCSRPGQVIKFKPSGEQYTYFLHYMGWNSRWDKWVVESDLMPAGPEALEMQKQLKDKKKKEKVSSA